MNNVAIGVEVLVMVVAAGLGALGWGSDYVLRDVFAGRVLNFHGQVFGRCW